MARLCRRQRTDCRPGPLRPWRCRWRLRPRGTRRVRCERQKPAVQGTDAVEIAPRQDPKWMPREVKIRIASQGYSLQTADTADGARSPACDFRAEALSIAC